MTASEGARCRCAASRVNRDEVRIKRDVVGLMLPISLGSSWIVESNGGVFRACTADRSPE